MNARGFAYVFVMMEGTMAEIKIRPTADEKRHKPMTEERRNASDLSQIPMVCLKYILIGHTSIVWLHYTTLGLQLI